MADTVRKSKPTASAAGDAQSQNEAGLQHFGQWQVEKAIEAFQSAIAGDPDNPEYHLNLARAYARSGNYQEAMRSLGNYRYFTGEENPPDKLVEAAQLLDEMYGRFHDS